MGNVISRVCESERDGMMLGEGEESERTLTRTETHIHTQDFSTNVTNFAYPRNILSEVVCQSAYRLITRSTYALTRLSGAYTFCNPRLLKGRSWRVPYARLA